MQTVGQYVLVIDRGTKIASDGSHTYKITLVSFGRISSGWFSSSVVLED